MSRSIQADLATLKAHGVTDATPLPLAARVAAAIIRRRKKLLHPKRDHSIRVAHYTTDAEFERRLLLARITIALGK